MYNSDISLPCMDLGGVIPAAESMVGARSMLSVKSLFFVPFLCLGIRGSLMTNGTLIDSYSTLRI